jgi:hypothetical protein
MSSESPSFIRVDPVGIDVELLGQLAETQEVGDELGVGHIARVWAMLPGVVAVLVAEEDPAHVLGVDDVERLL